MDAPLLRSPPFPGVRPAVSEPRPSAEMQAIDPLEIDGLFAGIRDARVGGRFWLAPANRRDAAIVVRAKSVAEIEAVRTTLSDADRAAVFWSLPAEIAKSPAHEDAVSTGEIDPWSLLESAPKLYAHGDDEWVALGHIAGCTIHLLSEGRFGVPGAADTDIRALVVRALATARYRNPFTGGDETIEAAIVQLADWRVMLDANRGIVSACGMAWWKRREIRRFLWTPDQPLRFFRSERRAVAHAARSGGAVAVWPSRITAKLTMRAHVRGVPLIRVEDGFVRSVGLGSNLVPPSSVIVDRRGIHFDPDQPSDLETLFAGTLFAPALLSRAQELRRIILRAGISKYSGGDDQAFPARRPGRRLVLVPGQVEDDMSVRAGGHGLSSNLELLRRVRLLEPDAEIWFRPHPDVDAGHRVGAVREDDALAHADRVVRGGAMARLLDMVDAVHVLTSLTGFEALMRGLEVTCHGTPFYAGWGLTRDLAPLSERRGRMLTLDQLVAGALILYPRYLDPVTGLPCPPEILIRRITDGAALNRLGWVTRVREMQGRLMKRLA